MPNQPRRLGRPSKSPKPGTRASLGLKVTADIKQRLDEAARANGRTQSQETEVRLEQSFRNELLLPQLLDSAFGPEASGLLMLLGQCIRRTEIRTETQLRQTEEEVANWSVHPWTYQQAAEAIEQVLSQLRPSGEVREPHIPATTTPDAEYMRKIGRHTAGWAIHALIFPDGGSDLSPFTDAILTRLSETVHQLRGRNRETVVRAMKRKT